MNLPPSYPDELLLGRLIRYITLSGEDVGELVNRVFDSSRASIHPQLTAGLAGLANLSMEDVDDLLYQQTLAPLFFFYLPQHAKQLKKYLLANDGTKALRESQLPSFGNGNSVCLKWCPLCAQQDIEQYGVAYWHRSHQVSGVTACFQHLVLLQRTELSRQRIVNGLFPEVNQNIESANHTEQSVAIFSHKLLLILNNHNRVVDVVTQYRQRLNELGYITARGRVRRQALLDAFYMEIKDYRPCIDTILPRNNIDYRYLSQLLESRISHHPFRHLLFGSWLFFSPQALFQSLLIVKPALDVQPTLISAKVLEKRCLTLLEEGHSLAEVYRITGKSRSYLKRIAALYGVALNLKPSVLTLDMRCKIIRLARLGMHRKNIVTRVNVGIGTVEQVISSVPGLVEWRKQCHFESKRRRCRLTIARYQQRYPSAIRRDIKFDCNAVFFWLYLYDRDWLETVLPAPTKPIGHGEFVHDSD